MQAGNSYRECQEHRWTGRGRQPNWVKELVAWKDTQTPDTIHRFFIVREPWIRKV
ncbi:H-NS family nucleoid-associated regulatory protein [Janthinobacterium lividum]|uniref:H-NS family nucleoid-associated regulatory protein n=1 Tax=Janthinobacterium lividum TaxID=29581 RepID=UPI000E0EB24C|nr:H-NS histone family protein [Janthinobacterium lividum]